MQIRPVGPVHHEHGPPVPAHRRQPRDVRLAAQIVRGSHEHRRRHAVGVVQGLFQPRRGDFAGAEAARLLGPEPADLGVRQGRGVQEGAVHIPGREQKGFCTRRAGRDGQIHHRPQAEAGALGGVEGPGRAEKGRGVVLALPENAGGLKQRVRPGDFRDVPGLTAQRPPALVPGYMQTQGVGGGVGPDEVRDGGGHRSASAAFSMMAHSMRLRKSSHPALYTPRMEPVAWKALAAQPPEQYSRAQQSAQSGRA